MNYKIIIPFSVQIGDFLSSKCLKPFATPVLAFIEDLSQHILKNNKFKQFPELVSMAFWMRKSNILRLRESFYHKRGNKIWLPRGLVFHIAPSNVDTIFIYSWFLSMLIGNKNIVRISNKKSIQLNNLLDLINKLLNKNKKYNHLKKRFVVVQYEHDKNTTSYFSELCDTRVIWGGDNTIKEIRAISLKPTASEIVFADKFSISIIKAKKFLTLENKALLINNFFNDAYWFLQMACSSPRLIVWLGNHNDISESRDLFWEMLEDKIQQNPPDIVAANAIDKLFTVFSLGIENSVMIEPSITNYINRVLLSDPNAINIDLHCGAGLFYETYVKELEELVPIISRKYQTASVFGISENEISNFIKNNLLNGIDRFVPIGKAHEFHPIWDGYDLMREFCREVTVII